jgi:stage II sporulation protein D
MEVSADSLRFALDRDFGWNLLRSDWYEVSLSNSTLHFEGKGYGHGVGLCQAGAREMALEKNSARDILGFYFPGTHIGITATDSHWMETQAAGWTLRTTGPSSSLLQTGNEAWAMAQERVRPLLGSIPLIHPVVYQFPSTELFRQSSGEPGWVRAATRGEHVFMQPEAILRSNGTNAATLLHEFLHVLIEQAATEKAPLWMREGLVEVLADSPMAARQNRAPRISMAQVDAGLADRIHPAASRMAHEEAKSMVLTLLARHGQATVGSWLQKGIPADISAGLALEMKR